MRSLLLLVLVCMVSTVFSQSRSRREKPQQWLGIYNLYGQYNNDASTAPFLDTLVLDQEERNRGLSFGLNYRKEKSNGRYFQVDLLEFDWRKNYSSQIIIYPDRFPQPFRGSEVIDLNFTVGYQQGKILPIQGKFYGDLGVRGFASYQRNTIQPITSASFPRLNRNIGIGLNMEAGILFQLNERLRIGYYLTPLQLFFLYNKTRLNNPVLTERQQTSTSFEFNTDVFPTGFGIRSLHVYYRI